MRESLSVEFLLLPPPGVLDSCRLLTGYVKVDCGGSGVQVRLGPARSRMLVNTAAPTCDLHTVAAIAGPSHAWTVSSGRAHFVGTYACDVAIPRPVRGLVLPLAFILLRLEASISFAFVVIALLSCVFVDVMQSHCLFVIVSLFS